MVRRIAACILVTSLWMSTAVATSTAADTSSLVHDLETGGDFRVRVAAALALGKSGSPSARPALEKALHDPHPAVRAAAAAGLGALGDRNAVTALRDAASRETSPSVKNQLVATIARLDGGASGHATKAKFLLALGQVQNRSHANAPAITTALQRSAREQLAQIPGVELLADGADLRAQASSRKLPVLAVDGSLTRLDKGVSGREITYSARVEFLIRRMPDQALKGSVSGAAQALADARALTSERALAELQTDAVAAAVESAMRGAPTALEAAAR
jgi:hypothetical protein